MQCKINSSLAEYGWSMPNLSISSLMFRTRVSGAELNLHFGNSVFRKTI